MLTTTGLLVRVAPEAPSEVVLVHAGSALSTERKTVIEESTLRKAMAELDHELTVVAGA